MMDCASFIDRMDALLDDDLSAEERGALDRHLNSCADCRELSRALGAESIEAPPGMTASILKSTSGSACTSAEGRLCDWVDRELGRVDDELVRLHLASCVDCASLGRVLARMPQDLSRMAELQPDERFVSDVLTRTLPVRKRFERWTARLTSGWQSMLQRPRIAMEGAYVGTIVLVLLFGTPGSPLAAVPQRALELARVNPVSELQPLEAQVRADVGAAMRATGGKVAGASRSVANDVAHYSADKIETLRLEFGTFWSRLASKAENDNTTGSEQSEERMNGDEQ